ncbi:unnamed protein product, partial [Iphiclides podalirius]
MTPLLLEPVDRYAEERGSVNPEQWVRCTRERCVRARSSVRTGGEKRSRSPQRRHAPCVFDAATTIRVPDTMRTVALN